LPGDGSSGIWKVAAEHTGPDATPEQLPEYGIVLCNSLDGGTDGARHVQARPLGRRPATPVTAEDANRFGQLAGQSFDFELELSASLIIPFTKRVEISALSKFVELFIQFRNSAPVIPLRLIVQYWSDVARSTDDQILIVTKAREPRGVRLQNFAGAVPLNRSSAWNCSPGCCRRR
jgi:hypothetical protein